MSHFQFTIYCNLSYYTVKSLNRKKLSKYIFINEFKKTFLEKHVFMFYIISQWILDHTRKLYGIINSEFSFKIKINNQKI